MQAAVRSETDHHAELEPDAKCGVQSGLGARVDGSDASAKVPLRPAQAENHEEGTCEDSRGPAAVHSRQPDATVPAAKKTGMTRRAAHLRRCLGLVGDRGAVGRLAISANAELAQVSQPNHRHERIRACYASPVAFTQLATFLLCPFPLQTVRC